MNMKYLLSLLVIAATVMACHHAEEHVVVPAAPKSVAEVTSAVKGQHYKVAKLGTLSPFAMDSLNPVNWQVQEQDTSKFFRDYATKELKFKIDFSNDTTVSFMDEDKTTRGFYSVDNDANLGYEEEKPGIKLRIKYSDSMEFGGNKTAATMTQSYLVQGLGNKEIILETGKSINNRKLVVWMKAD